MIQKFDEYGKDNDGNCQEDDNQLENEDYGVEFFIRYYWK